MALGPLTFLNRLVKRVRIVLVLTRAQSASADDRDDDAWRLMQKAERILGQPWPNEAAPGFVNLQVAFAALATKRFQLAFECASEAERQFRTRPGKLSPAASSSIHATANPPI